MAQQVETRRSARWITTRHAILRWIDRVNPGSDFDHAIKDLLAFLDTGTVRSRPRHWTKVPPGAVGALYVYNSALPRVCVVIRNSVTRTVLTRDLISDRANNSEVPLHRYH